MKIVQLQRETNTVPYQVIRATGTIAGIFSLIVCVLMIVNNLSLKRLDPIHSTGLTNLVTQLRTNPRDAALREEIRELDYLTRKAFFTSQHFNQTAILLLLGGLAATVISFKTLRAYQGAPPYPDSSDPKDDLAADAIWARKSVTAAGLVLVGFALALSLPWKSPLDEPVASLEAPAVSKVAKSEAPVAIHAPSEPGWASLEEREKQWPQFLGAGAGAAAGNIPVAWDVKTGTGLRWKSKVPLPGMNSPIVWEGRVFLAGANADAREIFCYAVDSGKLLWRQALRAPDGAPGKPPRVSEDTGYSASTLVTDGKRVFAIFANGDLAACDFEGKLLWQRSLGDPESTYGYASSLAMFEDVVIVQFDRREHGFIAGIDGATGQDRWKTKREVEPSWASPRLARMGGEMRVLTAANPCLSAYDPRSGEEIWRIDCLKDAEVAVTPVFAEGTAYVAGESISLAAIDLASRKVLWENREAVPGVSTPLIANGCLFVGLSEGGIVCLDVKTGQERWRQDTDEGIFSSPVLAGDRVCLIDRGGTAHIFKADGGRFEALGSPVVDEEVYATPALTRDGLFVRGTKHLFRFSHE